MIRFHNLFLAACMILLWTGVKAQTPVDSLASKTQQTDSLTRKLKEVTVTQQLMSSYAGHDVLYLSKENREFGNDALDAISSLPQFRTAIGEDALTNLRGQQVTVFIEGRRADILQLKALKADMIQRIDYYIQPPAKYATMTDGEVIDVMLKHVNRKAYSLMASTQNALNAMIGDNKITGLYTDSLNMLTGIINESNRNLNRQYMSSTYSYAGQGRSRFATDHGLYHGFALLPLVAYQRYQGKHQFYTRAFYTHIVSREGGLQGVEMSDVMTSADGRRLSSTKNAQELFSLDLYYTYHFTRRRSLTIDVINNMGASRSTSHLLLDMMPPYQDNNFESRSHFNNHTYSLIAQADYSAPLWQGQFNGGIFMSFKDLRQKFNYADEYTTNNSNYYAYAGYSVSAGLWSYNLSMGMSMIRQHTDTRTVTRFIPRPTIGISWNNRRNFTIGFNGRIQSYSPAIGNLTASSSAIDRRFFSIGNPDLKPYTYYSAKLTPMFFTPDNRLHINMTLSYSYSHRPYATAVMTQGDYAVMQPVNISHSQSAWATAGISYLFPFGLRLSPGAVILYDKYPMPAQRVEETSVYGSLSASLTRGKFTFLYTGATPETSYSGNIYSKKRWRHVVYGQWANRRVTIGLQYIHSSLNQRTGAHIPDFSYEDAYSWSDFRNMIKLFFNYSFNKGKSRRQPGKRINNSDDDAGLTESNSTHTLE